MRRPSWIAVLLLGVIAAGVVGVALMQGGRRERSAATASAETAPRVRSPAVAGTFYPSSPDRLRADVRLYLQEARGEPEPGDLVALIVPHAGYEYSGFVAGYAYRELEGRSYDTVVVIGPSHRVPFTGVALTGMDQWLTPLGPVGIDRAGGEALAERYPEARALDAAHEPEHSIEVQLPFLQMALEEFKALPILMGASPEETCSGLAEALAAWARGRSVLLIASSDMSHYPPYDDAVQIDHETLKAIETLDPAEVEAAIGRLASRRVPGLATCLCGEAPVKTVLAAARLLGADRVKTLRYANSGDVALGMRDGVVGYCAVAIYRSGGPASQGSGEGGELSAEQQQRLLSLARQAIEEQVRAGRRVTPEERDPALLRRGAVFVTLRKKGELRGCIGGLQAERALAEAVCEQAVNAAVRDPRFPPVEAGELADLEIEVSVLSPLRKVASAEEVDVRRHGVVVVSGTRSGVFLPQVARETGWTREELLSHLCRDKAGLPGDAWRRGATLHTFTAQAFSGPAPSEAPDARDG